MTGQCPAGCALQSVPVISRIAFFLLVVVHITELNFPSEKVLYPIPTTLGSDDLESRFLKGMDIWTKGLKIDSIKPKANHNF